MFDRIKAMSPEAISRAQSAFMTKVYGWMLFGLLITAVTSFYAPESPFFLSILTSGWIWGLFIAEFVLVIAISGFVMRMPPFVASILFLLYSFLNGITISGIFFAYSTEAIYTTFFIAAGMFGALSLFGWATKKDLSGVGRFMFMGLIGIILASIVNIFLGLAALEFIICVIGVIVFSGLTAYDTQKLKEMSLEMMQDGEIAARGAIVGALMLYLDFINLFLFLLRLFGGSRD